MSGAIEVDSGVTGGFVDDGELLEELLGIALELNEDMWGHMNLRDELRNPTTCFLSVIKSDLVRVWVDTDGPPSEGWAWFDVDDKLNIVDMACNYDSQIRYYESELFHSSKDEVSLTDYLDMCIDGVRRYGERLQDALDSLKAKRHLT